MSMSEDEYGGFAIGNRVMVIRTVDDAYLKSGMVGTVCDFTDEFGDENVGVNFDEGSPFFHNCFGNCESEHGFYVAHTNLCALDIDLGELDISDKDMDFLIGIYA